LDRPADRRFLVLAAIAWVLFTVVFAITLVNWRFGSRYVNY